MDSIIREDERKIDTAIVSPSNDLTHIVKGKRTKRQRPQSPIPFTVANCSEIGPDNVSNNNSTTEEDEDTAKTLILLSQGPSPDSSPNITINNNNCNHNHNHNLNLNQNEEESGTGCYKFTSKRYIETSTIGNGKAGIYVYECKTCNRTFPSFQALGGHRASHKKPKLAVELERKRPVFDDEDLQLKTHYINNAGLSLQLGNRPPASYINNKSGSKVHECAICGAEFTSGQALGGHMKRHRGGMVAAGGNGANTTLSLSPTSTPIGITHHYSPEEINNEKENRNKKERIGFFLDLNLPATPEEEDGVNRNYNRDLTEVAAVENFPMQQNHHHHHHYEEQKQQQQQSQSPLVLSAAPAMVDCHY